MSSASWPLFGQAWPAGLALADEMSRFGIEGKRILEVGCGLAIASLVLSQRGADVTASDQHPLAEEFLRINVEANGFAPIPFRRIDWADTNPDLGRFDLVIGSDIVYERDQPAMLASFFGRHGEPGGEVVVADPCRPWCGKLVTAMRAEGYACTNSPLPLPGPKYEGQPPGRLMRFKR